MLMLRGAALRGKALDHAGRIAAKTACRLMSEFNDARAEGGAGQVRVDRLPYAVDGALAALKSTRQPILAGAKPPVWFFAYPEKPSVLAPEDAAVTKLAGVGDDLEGVLRSAFSRCGPYLVELRR